MPAAAVSIQSVVTGLAELSPPAIETEPTLAYRGDVRPSAVLILLADGANGAEVLLTRRSMNVSSHRGEVSFPGGRIDAGEDALAAALREAHEEVGVRPDQVTVVGQLYPIGTYVSRSWIVPIVGYVAEPLALQARTGEVDRVFWVPLHDLTKPDTFHEELWPTPHRDERHSGERHSGERPGHRPIFFFELEYETVWGATARMLHQLLRVAHRIEVDEPPAL